MAEVYNCLDRDSPLPADFYQYMLFIKPRYAMYTGAEKLRDIQTFIEGFVSAVRVLPVEDNTATRFYEGFHDFVCKEYNRQTTAESWATIITRKMKENHKLAIEEFYRLFDLFFIQYQ